jgi:U4/U6 small nuclear ribonucleoprotein PRP4
VAENKRKEEMMNKLEMEKKVRNMYIPTSDRDVKLGLRQFGYPICYFGEDAIERRERLK